MGAAVTHLGAQAPTPNRATCLTRWPPHAGSRATGIYVCASNDSIATTRMRASTSRAPANGVASETMPGTARTGTTGIPLNPHTRPRLRSECHGGTHSGSTPLITLAGARHSQRASSRWSGRTNSGLTSQKDTTALHLRGSSYRSNRRSPSSRWLRGRDGQLLPHWPQRFGALVVHEPCAQVHSFLEGTLLRIPHQLPGHLQMPRDLDRPRPGRAVQ